MKIRKWVGSMTLPLLAVAVMAAPLMKAAEMASGSPEVSKLFADAKAEAVELKNDSADMETFTRSSTSWQSYAGHITMIKEHVNAVGRLIAQLKDMENQCAPWQKGAIERITPLLKELADNTESTIDHLNENQGRVHMQPFKDYVRANSELASDLAALIGDFVDYGAAKDNVERLEGTLEVS